MLRSLDIRDMLIIDRLELDFRPGLNVLTGETGAGKSILLDSLGFVLGWRGRADLVRQGAEEGEVVAVFDLPKDHPAREVLTEAGLPVQDELILRRVNRTGGAKSAWVNDRRASGDVLRALSDTLVELHGQQDDKGLLNPRTHRVLLDQFGGLEGQVEAVRMAWRGLAKARKAREAAEAEGRMGDALRWLEGVADRAGEALDPAIEALNRALVELGEAVQGVEDAIEALAFDPMELERTEERLFAIRGLARKHGVAPDDLGTFAADIAEKLAALDKGEGDIADLMAAEASAAAVYETASEALSRARTEAARRLDAAMGAELAPLKMERAVFTTGVTVGEAGPDGRDDVVFTVATNPGAPSGALNKIASGGELSRFLLALKVCLTRDAQGLTMIFDEIDRGVGGATADAVGRRLKALADEGGQVLVVTHSPQVAALGAHHWRVAKAVENDVTLSRVTPLDAGERVDEIARMISGDTVTDEARAAAASLLA